MSSTSTGESHVLPFVQVFDESELSNSIRGFLREAVGRNETAVVGARR